MATTPRIAIGACSDRVSSASSTVLTWPTQTRKGDARRATLAAAMDTDCDLTATRASAFGGSSGRILATLSRVVSNGAPRSALVVADPGASAPNGGSR